MKLEPRLRISPAPRQNGSRIKNAKSLHDAMSCRLFVFVAPTFCRNFVIAAAFLRHPHASRKSKKPGEPGFLL
jgi:hypothetical protein